MYTKKILAKAMIASLIAAMFISFFSILLGSGGEITFDGLQYILSFPKFWFNYINSFLASFLSIFIFIKLSKYEKR